MLAPAFQFYTNEWLANLAISLTTPAQEGALIRLKCYAWSDPDCSLPDDDAELAQLSRLGEGWFKGGSTVIRRFFVPHPDKPGRLVDLRLLQERKKQDAWREKSRQGGIQSAKTRASEVKGGSTVVQRPLKRMVEPKGNSSSSSSIKNKRNVSTSSPPANGSNRSRRPTEVVF